MNDLKAMLLDKLKSIPGVEVLPSPVAGGTALFCHGKPFAHFHNDNELDIRLTQKIIRQQKLLPYPDSIHHPNRSKNSVWTEVRFYTENEVNKVAGLIALAVAEC